MNPILRFLDRALGLPFALLGAACAFVYSWFFAGAAAYRVGIRKIERTEKKS